MAIKIAPLSPANEPAYAAFCDRHDGALIYHSLLYRDVLRAILPVGWPHYLVASDEERVVGILPLFLISGPLGTVANSLPFFGSHGGPLVAEDRTDEVTAALRHALADIFASAEVIAATIVENPYAANAARIAALMPDGAFSEPRIGQVSPIPTGDDADMLVEAVLAQCHQKTRNLIRKGLKADFAIGHDGSTTALDRLAELHGENMAAIGGKAKPRQVFEAIARTLRYDRDYRIYHALTPSGECAATLLVLYYKSYVEYFTPCINANYRSDQPLSALIVRAMVDARLERGSARWNWGGTWASQEGVYRFKSRWGAIDTDYRYAIHLREGGERLLTAAANELERGYPYFYTVPFSELAS